MDEASPMDDNSSIFSKLVLILRNRNFEDVIFFQKNMTVTNFIVNLTVFENLKNLTLQNIFETVLNFKKNNG